MYSSQVNNLNKITTYYGYPAKQLDDLSNISAFSNRKVGEETLNKSQSSPKSLNTSEVLI